MGNPFYNQNPAGNNGSFGGNPLDFLKQVQKFGRNFQGDPRQRVQDLLNSGKMSQQQFNYFSQLAQQIQSLCSKFNFRI